MTQDSSTPSTEQVRLIRDALNVRYGVDPPASTTARIHELVDGIYALGPITQSTFRAALTINAVQGDPMAFEEAHPYPNLSQHVSPAEQGAISVISMEAATVRRELAPAVTGFLLHSQSAMDDDQWTRLLERLFQIIGRLESMRLAPDWDLAHSARRKVIADVQILQSRLEANDHPTSERDALTAIETEMSAFHNDIAPAVVQYIEQQPNAQDRSHLVELMLESLVRLNRIEILSDQVKENRKAAVTEIARLLGTLETSPVASEPDPPHTINQAEQDMIAFIASEQLNVQNVLGPAVATFPRSAAVPNALQDRRHLLHQLFATVERLDAAHIDFHWEQAREDRRNVVRAVETLQSTLDALPTCTEEQTALTAIATERSQAQFLLSPAVTHPSWAQAIKARDEVQGHVRQLYDKLQQSRRNEAQEAEALRILGAENSQVQFQYTPAVKSFLENPNEKERAQLSEVFSQALERLDAISLKQEWEAARQLRRSTVAEIQRLQAIRKDLAPAVLQFTLGAGGSTPAEREKGAAKAVGTLACGSSSVWMG
ncbi:hypothetical protein FB45DRAFT_860496 [Roridomyces roridus]|uniref:BAG domain-containing protein n=1 Tax=Roridomyces roridus TaxID=1738132 RepID=A0AAD7CEZ1_9AGAR|nr:hypothetical protein FB45DRAFT_860496 [Roridomyces roridus]